MKLVYFLVFVFIVLLVITLTNVYFEKKAIRESFADSSIGIGTNPESNPVSNTGGSAGSSSESNPVSNTGSSPESSPESSAGNNTLNNTGNNAEIGVNLRTALMNENTKLKNEIKKLQDEIQRIGGNFNTLQNDINTSKGMFLKESSRLENNLSQLGDFHDTYDQEFKKLVQTKLNYSDPAFETNQKIQESRIRALEKEISSIQTLEQKVSQREDNEIRSIICRGNGSTLNVHPVFSGRNPTGYFVIFLNNRCVNYSVDQGTITLTEDQCDLSNGNQRFKLLEINSYNEYNQAIMREESDDQMLVLSNDDIYYPFYLVIPENHESKCLYITNDNELYIKGIEKSPANRFRKSKVYNIGDCSQN